MPDFAIARKNMVDCQIRTAGVTNPAVIAAFEAIPRELFSTDKSRSAAYTDISMPVGEERFTLEPSVHARMIQAVEPKTGDVALDIGCGTGYSAAVLAPLVSTVIAVEEKARFLTTATMICNELGICNVVVFKGKLNKGCPAHAPFDLVFMNGSVAEMPGAIARQLSPGGRLITILRAPGAATGRVTLVQSLGGTQFSSYTLFEASAPYLPGFEPQPAFQF